MYKHVCMCGDHTRSTDNYHVLFPQRGRRLGRPGRDRAGMCRRGAVLGAEAKSELRDQLDEYVLFWFFCEMTDFYLYSGKLHQTCQTPSSQMCT